MGKDQTTVKNALEALVKALERGAEQYVDQQVTDWARNWIKTHGRTVATTLKLTVQGGHKKMSTFTVDTTDGSANLQFADDKGDAVAGPNDSVTGSPVVPVITSDNEGVLTAATAVAGSTPGSWTAALTPVAAGTANIGVAALTNSDGSAVNDAAGNAFPVPAAVEVTVTAGAAAELTLSVAG